MSEYYGTTDLADTYFLQDRLGGEFWAQNDPAQRLVALKHATRLIDRLNFIGTKAVATQELEFPRGDDTTVPTNIQLACYEIAFALLDGRDVELEDEFKEVAAESFGAGRLRTDPRTVNQAKVHGIPSTIAWSLLQPYLGDGRSLTLSRVS
jgi:hypothetical protein